MRFSHLNKIVGLCLVQTTPQFDSRGSFARAFCEREFFEEGINFKPVQANFSTNTHEGTFRGFHFQVPPHEEAKLVHVLRGTLIDIVIDLRPTSPTFRNVVKLGITPGDALYVPAGCGHGYMTLEPNTELLYLMGEFYRPGSYFGLRYNDPAFAAQIAVEPKVISEQDTNWPDWKDPTLIE